MSLHILYMHNLQTVLMCVSLHRYPHYKAPRIRDFDLVYYQIPSIKNDKPK